MKLKIPYFLENKIVKHFGLFHAEIKTIIYKDNEIIKTQKQFGHSFTANFLQCLYGEFHALGYTSSPNYLASQAPYRNNYEYFARDGSFTSTPGVTGRPFEIDNLAGGGISGILLSTDTTVPTPLDQTSDTHKISKGFGGGQINYLGHSGTGMTISGNTCTLPIVGIFANVSGGDITVNKIYLSTEMAVIFSEKLNTPDVIPTGYCYSVAIQFQITT
jgi:hypothetical protein